jgi:hypothetical protein
MIENCLTVLSSSFASLSFENKTPEAVMLEAAVIMSVPL